MSAIYHITVIEGEEGMNLRVQGKSMENRKFINQTLTSRKQGINGDNRRPLYRQIRTLYRTI
jgi:hypothetical protein